MEELKWRYMLAFVDRMVISDVENTQVHEPGSSKSPEILALYKCSKVILEVEEEARAWLKIINTQKFDDEFFQGPLENRVPFESLAGNFTMVQNLTHELMLLENQIPYLVLQKPFDLVSSSKTASNGLYPDMSLEDYIFWFFDSVPMLRFKYLKVFINNEDGACNHLLDMLYHVCKVTFVQTLSSRNLITLEQTSIGRHFVTSYVKLMSILIRSPEDANLLDRLGIIKKSDDVEDISTFFKSLSTQVAFVDLCYTDLCNRI